MSQVFETDVIAVGEVFRKIFRKNQSLFERLYDPSDGYHPSNLGSFVIALTLADQFIDEELRLPEKPPKKILSKDINALRFCIYNKN